MVLSTEEDGKNAAYDGLIDICLQNGYNTYSINTLETCTGVPLANGTRITATYQVTDFPVCLINPLCDIEQYEEYFEEPEISISSHFNATECINELTYEFLGNRKSSVALQGGVFGAILGAILAVVAVSKLDFV